MLANGVPSPKPHDEHEKRNGQRDANWPDWYAAFVVAEQAGTESPK
jgi:hypothetical protein